MWYKRYPHNTAEQLCVSLKLMQHKTYVTENEGSKLFRNNHTYTLIYTALYPESLELYITLMALETWVQSEECCDLHYTI
jgi:hypothetical protein